MIKFKLSLSLVIFGIIYCCTGCSGLSNQNSNNKSLAFDTNPNHYKTAQMTQEVSKPKYIANNLEKQPLFPVPEGDKLTGDLNISAVPPHLKGKIQD